MEGLPSSRSHLVILFKPPSRRMGRAPAKPIADDIDGVLDLARFEKQTVETLLPSRGGLWLERLHAGDERYENSVTPAATESGPLGKVLGK
jgi:hypothetical protein